MSTHRGIPTRGSRKSQRPSARRRRTTIGTGVRVPRRTAAALTVMLVTMGVVVHAPTPAAARAVAPHSLGKNGLQRSAPPGLSRRLTLLTETPLGNATRPAQAR